MNLSQISNDQSINNDKLKKNKNIKKRTISLNDDDEKRTKLNITVDNFGEASRLFNKIFERIDSLDDECNRIDGVNVTLKNELKDLTIKYNKLSSKHSNLIKDFDVLKITNTKLQNDLNNLDSKIINQSVVDMDGSSNTQITPHSFAGLFKSTENKKSLSEPMAEIINTVNDYNRQKKGRENNLVIFGINDVNRKNVNNKIKSLFQKLNVDKIKFNNPILLVKQNVTNTSPPIKVTLENEEAKFQILKSAELLREINQQDKTKISISQDLNEIDRERNKKLMEEKRSKKIEICLLIVIS